MIDRRRVMLISLACALAVPLAAGEQQTGTVLPHENLTDSDERFDGFSVLSPAKGRPWPWTAAASC